MGKLLRLGIRVCEVFIYLASACIVFRNAVADEHVWTPRDSAAVRYFDWTGIVASPDGKKFFFKSFYGDLACDCNSEVLTVFDTDDVERALARTDSAKPEPKVVLRRQSSNHHGAAISSPAWEDNISIAYWGLNDKGLKQLYDLNVLSGAVTQLTDWPQGVGVDPLRKGSTVISDVLQPVIAPTPTYPSHVITLAEIQAAFSYNGRPLTTTLNPTPPITFVSYHGRPPWALKGMGVAWLLPDFSPDAHLIIAARVPTNVPESWSQYDAISVGSQLSDNFPVTRFVFVDPEHGVEKPILDAPTGLATRVGQDPMAASPRALWAIDDRHVILVNAALPLTASDPERAHMAYVLGYDLSSESWRILEPIQAFGKSGDKQIVTSAGWIKDGVELLIQHQIAGKPAGGTVYRLRGDRWVGSPLSATERLPDMTEPPKLEGGVIVNLRQSANDPPVVVASDGHREITLTAQDPALSGVERVREEPFRWQARIGGSFVGGLLLPKAGEGKPLPLAIQAYFYQPHTFSPDGPGRSPFAGQSLAARGIAVLNVNIPGTDARRAGTAEELAGFADEVDSAVDALAARGIVDRSRVGLIGFSRSAYEVYYVITHPGAHPMAAAVLDDGFTGSYSNYLWVEAVGGGKYDYERMYGGPFWGHKEEWLNGETTFNADRIKTPALFSDHGQQRLPLVLDTIGALSITRRPFEYLMFPEGGHGLEMPRERFASQEATVDWMSFWLQGYEDPDPAKAEQYKRWRVMQADWEKQKAREAAGHPAGSTPGAAPEPAENKKN